MGALGDALLLVSGAVFLVTTAIAFWALLPRGGKTHRWANTEWEPYIAVAICGGVALSFTMILSGIIDLIG